MNWLAGTSGYSYPGWRGSFYPAKIPASEMLAHYASRLPAVEINNTFYRLPSSEVLARWRDAVPATFRFAVKAPRRITHHAKLADCGDAVRFFAERLEALGDKLGCVLFQLPPYLRQDATLLDGFLALWPRRYPAAVEFRHGSWEVPATAATLAKHGAVLCVADHSERPSPDLSASAEWLYLRLRQPEYDDHALAGWLRRGGATSAERGFVFFKHEDEGAGPALAARFLRLAKQADAASQTRTPLG